MTSDVFKNIQPTVPYTAPVAPQRAEISVEKALPATNVEKTDTLEISKNADKPKKKGIIASTKNFIANIKKFFATTGTYAKGTLKGLFSGAALGSIIYTAGEIANHFLAKKEGAHLVHNKVLGVVAAVIALGANLWNASLDATEEQSNIDHRYIGHKQ